MKALLKNIKGGLKMSMVALPAIALAGGLAGVVGFITDAAVKINALYDEVRNSEIVQELIEQERQKLEENDISLEEYSKRESYLESDEFISGLLKSNEQLADKEDSIYSNMLYSLIFTLPVAVGACFSIDFYTEIFKEFDEKRRCVDIIESAKEDFEEAREIRHQAKKEKEKEKEIQKYEKEIQEYDEEIVH